MTQKQWLEKECKCTHVKEVRIVIGKKRGKKYGFSGCMFVNPRLDPKHPSIMLLGDMPKHRKKSCYTNVDETWYVASYLTQKAYESLKPAQLQFHPFGPSFIISKWTAKESIDEYDRYKMDRIPMMIINENCIIEYGKNT